MLILTSCQTSERLVFNGNTVVTQHPKHVEILQGYSIALEGEYTGIMYAYDGMLVFYSDKHPDGFLYLYDSKTGKRISAIGRRGNGPGEFVNLLFFGNFEKKSDEIHLWVNDFLRNNIILFNTQGERIREINTSKFKSTNDYGIGAFHVLNDSLFLAYVQPYELFENKVASPSWHVFNYQTGETIKEHKPFGNYRTNGEWHNFFPTPRDLLSSYGAIRPDKSKLADMMFFLKRVYMLNIETDKLKLIATKDAPDLNRITSGGTKTEYYRNLQCDNLYIYVMETNGKQTSGTINVFDWDGNFVRILRISEDTDNFAFDPIRRILYAKNDAEEIMAYDLNFLYK